MVCRNDLGAIPSALAIAGTICTYFDCFVILLIIPESLIEEAVLGWVGFRLSFGFCCAFPFGFSPFRPSALAQVHHWHPTIQVVSHNLVTALSFFAFLVTFFSPSALPRGRHWPVCLQGWVFAAYAYLASLSFQTYISPRRW